MLSPWEFELAVPACCWGATSPTAAAPLLSQNSPGKQMSYDWGSEREGN